MAGDPKTFDRDVYGPGPVRGSRVKLAYEGMVVPADRYDEIVAAEGPSTPYDVAKQAPAKKAAAKKSD